MPDETTTADGAEMGSEAHAPQATTAPVQAASQQTSPAVPPDLKTMVIPTGAMKRIKEEEFGKGKQAALEQLARDAGYESHTDFISALARLKNGPAAAAPVPPAAKANTEEATDDVAAAQAGHAVTRAQSRQEMAIQRNLEKALNERNKYANIASEARKQAEAAKAETDALRAEMQLRTVAAGVGVQDVDYAITLLTRAVEKMTPEQAEKFDERAFFEGLRQSKPLLFGEAVQPATTGVGGGGAPKPPSPGQVASQAAAQGKVDARKMTPQQFQELIRARNINPNA
jgi:hypothetical protein